MSLSNIRIFVQKTTVNCRIGSLEMWLRKNYPDCPVNCRIGSLEIDMRIAWIEGMVNCRIGSLEIT